MFLIKKIYVLHIIKSTQNILGDIVGSKHVYMISKSAENGSYEMNTFKETFYFYRNNPVLSSVCIKLNRNFKIV